MGDYDDGGIGEEEMNGARRKWLRDMWRAFVIGDKRLHEGPNAQMLQKRLWKCMKKAYRPGMNADQIIREALRL